jgi:hypothetical protein
MRNRFDADTNREARLDRRFEQEPSYGRRQRIPLVEAGTLKQRFEAIAERQRQSFRASRFRRRRAAGRI